MHHTLLIILCLLIVSCSGSQTQIYYYQFDTHGQNISISSKQVKSRLLISHIDLQSALNNRGIAMQAKKNQLINANWHLWSSAPDQMLLHSSQVSQYQSLNDWLVLKAAGLNNQNFNGYELQWELSRFNGTDHQTSRIAGLWRLYLHDEKNAVQLLKLKYFDYEVPLLTDGYDGLVSSLETNWQQINYDVSKEILGFYQDPTK